MRTSPRTASVALGLCAALFAAPALAAPDALGLNVHQSTGVGLDATRDAGLGWVRIDANWLDVEKSQGVYDWTLLDQVIDGARSRGLQVLAVLAYTPAWASQGDTKADGPNNDVPKAGTYAAFVTAAVGHFMNRVTHYELWNEPNLGQFFEGTPADYTSRILVPGADAVHAACAACKVVGPGVATVGGQYDVWMDAALTAAQSKIDILSGHDYAAFPQDSSGAGGTSDSFYNKLEKHRVITIGGTVVYEGPLSFKEVMDKHGATQPFWLTETGQEATYGDAAAEKAQALYYRRVLESMLTRPWWTATLFYEGFDEPSQPYHWGVVLHDTGAASGYDAKAVMALLQKASHNQPLFGGTGTDCEDGLDNDGDGLVDYPADPDCHSAISSTEGLPPVDAGAEASAQDDAGAGVDGGTPGGGGGCNTAGGAPGGGIGVVAGVLAWALRRRARHS